MSIYITGDCHGRFRKIQQFCREFKTTTDDLMIILGDVGLNYTLGKQDIFSKILLSKLPLTFFCIHGNHEERPENIPSYELKSILNKNIETLAYVEQEFPNLLFAADNQVCKIQNKYFYILGGAYSVDKFYRLAGYGKWFPSEQNEELKCRINNVLDTMTPSRLFESEALYNNEPINILTHTCPYKYRPIEAFLSGIDESTVDNSMEHLLDKIEDKIEYKEWYVGHWHIDKTIDKIHFLYDDIIEI